MTTCTSIREEFPILKKMVNGFPLIYLDSAATTHKPKRVIDAISEFYSEDYATVHRAIYELSIAATEKYDAARKKASRFLNASTEDEIIFTRGTTDSINFVAKSFAKRFLKAGDEIILTELEHHSNLVPWQMVAEEYGLKLHFIPINDQGEIILSEYERLLSKKTKIVSVAHVFNTAGTINPIKEMTKMAHRVGAKIFIDGAQAAARLPIDVQDIGCDFYAFSGHKSYGPTGIGILYGKMELLEEMPPIQGGGDMIDQVTLQKSTFQKPPLRFEAGTPMIAQVIGMKEALSFIEEVGITQIQAIEEELLHYSMAKLRTIPAIQFFGTSKQKAGIICFNIAGIHPLDLGTFLDLKGIAVRTGHHCSHPAMKRFKIDGCARISFGVYNTKEEIDRFFEVLSETISKLQK